MNAARDGRLSRRAALLGGIGLGAVAVAGCQREPGADPAQQLLASQAAKPDSVQPVITERKLSTARYREVDCVIIRPANAPAAPMPVCVALHDRLRGARSFLSLGLPQMLTGLVDAGHPPFAIAAVDGGNWVGYKDDDPQRMLSADLPDWLDRQDLAATPFAAIGLGEGGAGALNLVRGLSFSAVAAISPTLFETWPAAKRSEIYGTREQWEAIEPLRHTAEYSSLSVGLWCGNGDRDHLGTTKKFAQATGAKAVYGPGGHTEDYQRTALPEALRFVAEYL
ncbi:esterase [Actinokineospora sp. G85]|uniref:alpha/beta hydrolase n=1 Tax=Actinokineospora sp. G85 TaxID=3406626 RepID=UPI003C78D096